MHLEAAILSDADGFCLLARAAGSALRLCLHWMDGWVGGWALGGGGWKPRGTSVSNCETPPRQPRLSPPKPTAISCMGPIVIGGGGGGGGGSHLGNDWLEEGGVHFC